MKTTYIVSAYRTAVGKAPRGLFRFKRPDELAAETIEHMMSTLPDFDVTTIDDVSDWECHARGRTGPEYGSTNIIDGSQNQ